MLKALSRPLKYAIVFLEMLIVLSLFALLYNFFLPLGKGSSVVYFEETNVSAVIDTLKRNGYNMTDWDRYLLPYDSLPAKGWYHIGHSDEGRYHFLKQLNSEPAATMKIRVYPGETYQEVLERLAKDMKLSTHKLLSHYEAMRHFPQGDIFAGIYTVARDANEEETLGHLFSRSRKMLEQFKQEYFTHAPDDYTLKLLLTIASIIQKESNDPKEMPLISSVIYNRLNRGMKLQMDGTLNYGKYSHQIVTPERIRNDTTFYNTYKYKGLPPAPLASVSIEALKAAMFPAETEYLFFMLHKDGGHVFSKSYQEHLDNIRSFREYQKERKKLRAKRRSKKLTEEE